MTIRHMRIFIQVYSTESITKAAELLYMTQPAVTRAIREIERYYGVCMFDRINHRLNRTSAGEEFYAHALHIVEAFDQMEKELRNWDEIGRLRIGVTNTLGCFFLPEFREKGSTTRNLLEHFFSLHNMELHPVMESCNPQTLIHAVRCHLGITFLPEFWAQEAAKDGSLVLRELKSGDFIRENYVVWHENKFLTKAMQAFIRECLSHFFLDIPPIQWYDSTKKKMEL